MSAIEVTGGPVERGEEILTAEALVFLADPQARFGPRRDELLGLRRERRAAIAATATLAFLPQAADVRAAQQVAWADDFVDFLTLPAYDLIRD